MENEFSGIWHNQYGSELKLEADAEGRVIGKFRTAVGRAETKHIWKDRWFDVIGFANGELISLAINYGSEARGMSVISGKMLCNGSDRKIETQSFVRFSLVKEEGWRELNVCSVDYFPGPALKN